MDRLFVCGLVLSATGPLTACDVTSEAGVSGDASGDDASSGDDAPGDDTAAPTQVGTSSGDARGDAAIALPEAGSALAVFGTSPVDLGEVQCGSGSAGQPVSFTNNGTALLAVSATTTGTAFSVSPAVLSLLPGQSGALTVTANVPGSATAGTVLVGSLSLMTNDPGHVKAAIPLSVTPVGATIVQQSPAGTVAFPTTGIGTPAPAQQIALLNEGNAPATIRVGSPPSPSFTLTPPAGATTTMQPGETWTAIAGFTPASAAPVTTTVSVTVTGATCGQGLTSILLSGAGAVGQVTGWPTAPVDFGPANCGGPAPASQTFALKNTGQADAHLTQVSLGGAGAFATSAAVGQKVPAGGSLAVTVTAAPVPALASLTPITSTLTLATDGDGTPHSITLTEEPAGAVLSFDTSATPNFGSFGSVSLLQSASQAFAVKNSGNTKATVTLSTTSTSNAGRPAGFVVAIPTFDIAPGATQTDSAAFEPTSAGADSGTITMAATGAVCSPMPGPLALAGTGIGAGPSIAPLALAFAATCGGSAPPPQTITVANVGTRDMTWSLSGAAGPGASQYTVTSTPSPGLLAPGASATIQVAAAAIGSPAATPAPSALAAQLTVTTDVPFDMPHVIPLTETPLGDQLSFSSPNLEFGQIPVGTTGGPVAFTITNAANAGSPSASLTLALEGDGGTAYVISSAGITNLGPGAPSAFETVTFSPAAPRAYPSDIAIRTTDSLCTPLPDPMQLGGNGTEGRLSLSANAVAFGSDPADPKGLVDCNGVGLAHDISLSNVGNQPLHVTGLQLRLGSASPYALTGPATALPATLGIGGSTSITVTPHPMPEYVANPNDPTPFTDTLTITTDAAGDSPHAVSLIMQARGAVIAATPPLQPTWSFGTVHLGSIGTFTTAISNTGNASASVRLQGLAQPSIFGLASSPSTVAPNAVTALVGQFRPPSTDGAWNDQGTLVVTPQQALCAPLPGTWSSPTIALSGRSDSTPPVTVSGTLAFPASECGGAAPAGQAVTITNQTNQEYAYALSLGTGTHYSITAPGPGRIAPNESATVTVTANAVVPGPGVLPGSAPYADSLVIVTAPGEMACDAGADGGPEANASSAVTPTFVIPISWTVSGAVLSLREGQGPSVDANSVRYYPADTVDGFTLPMDNTGTTTASVGFAVAPTSAVDFGPTEPIQVMPGIGAAPILTASASAVPCPATTPATVAFVYAGPVCQPFAFAQVRVEACVGTRAQ
jgi:hypothetical protein